MADTKPDITVPADVWVNPYTLTGISAGSALTIQPKSDFLVAQIKAAQPLATDDDGVALTPFLFFGVDSGETGVWLKSVNRDSLVNVQVA